jgi:putative FmdB family regulatory protein
MPIYEYQCESCDTEFEKLVRPSGEEPSQCPSCESESIKRLISNTNFKLKGSGWYETDYADTGPSDRTESTAEESTDQADSSEASTAEAAEPAEET